jgi:hypothetical protein
MPFTIFYYVPAAVLIFKLLSIIFFYFENKNIITNYKHSDSIEFKNINGKIITENGLLKKKIQWCRFHILVNRNSIFIFPKHFYFIPDRTVNLIFSNADRKYTKKPYVLRKFNLINNSAELIYYPNHIIGSRKIQLQNLTLEQLSVFQEIKKIKNY